MPLKPVSRASILINYVVLAGVLIYFVKGAVLGKLALPGSKGTLILSGPLLWLACLSPFFFLAMTAVRFEMSIDLSERTRKTLTAVLAVLGFLSFFISAAGMA
ncbi:hypothetical protein GJ699_18810 [Duganella sp. FT80W]|uniref:Uncharacterized protein n=1 Tax=Duganella guangzhouensis TaxID=2666084 RepID=A0A6I2L6Y3_9BURK|nr:hypothetical protein [Duganella guangzhouensis]MRW92049.1 hypothetical protein [Duganella guangzhouensis]